MQRTLPRLSAIAAMVVAFVVLGAAPPTSAAPAPAGAVSGLGALSAVACPTSARCVGVGSDDNGNGKTALINTADAVGTAWAGSVSEVGLEAVACATPTWCISTAAGDVVRVDASTGVATLLRRLSAPAGEIATADSLACPNSTECFGVGFVGNEEHSKGLIARFNATGVLLGTTLEASATGFGGIACPTPTQCLLAKADYPHPEDIQVMDNGHLGAVHALPAKIYVQYLTCYKSVTCLALAGRTTSSQSKTDLLYEINPSTGAVGSARTIGGGFSGDDIACATANLCIVSGFAGGKPSIVNVTRGVPAAPRHVGGTAANAIACTDAGACFVVGIDGTEGLVERV